MYAIRSYYGEETGTTIEIEDDGTVKIAATSGEQASYNFV